MGIERRKLDGIVRSISVDYFGETVVVTYRPGLMTPQRAAELARARQQAEDDETDREASVSVELATRLSEIMVNWDVMEDGEPLLPSKENLMTFGNALLVHIATAIGQDQTPNAKTGRR
jgi:hypothetical protein